jgi:serine/threonine protein kinase
MVRKEAAGRAILITSACGGGGEGRGRMESSHFERAEALFHRALAQPQPSRDGFIEAETNGDSDLAARVRRLIRFADNASPTVGFMPAWPTGDDDNEIDVLLGARVGRYRIVRRLGDGGFGVVYEAEQFESVQRRVAMKVLRSGMDSRRVINRFSAERQALAMMDHPGIARIFDAGETDPQHGSRPYFVMELVDGEPITDYCDRKVLDWRARLELFIIVCQAVQHAHQKGIIHRDLKPSNILVMEVDGAAAPKVIDFGIAKAVRQDGALAMERTQVTQAQQLLGTPQYMSPEQADFDAVNIDTRTDIYSLGVILYELLTGTTPMMCDSVHGASCTRIQQLIREKMERPSTRVTRRPNDMNEIARKRRSDPASLQRRLRGEIDWIVLKALEPERERRYSSASAFAEDVRRHLNHEPVLAGPPSALYRMRKFVRRHRVGTAASMLIALALLAGMVGVVSGLVRMRSAAEQTVAVNQFMRDVLTSAAPHLAGADVRLVDVLRTGSHVAPERFADHPETEAQVHELLGEVYITLDIQAEATEEFAKAAQLWNEVVGPNDARTLRAGLRHVQSLLNQSLGREAERVLGDVLPRVQGTLGPDDALTLLGLRLQVGVHRVRGRLDEAETLARDLRMRLAPDDDKAQIELLTNLVSVLAARFASIGYEDDLRLYREIEALAKETTERSTRLVGPASIPTLRAITTQADMRWRLGDVDGAARLAEMVLQRGEGRFDPCHTIYLRAQEVLSRALHRKGDSASAAELQFKEIACVRQHLPGDAMALLVCIADAMPIIDRAGRWSEGEALAREYGALLQQLNGGHGAMLFSADLYVARFVSEQDRREEADALFAALFERRDEASAETAIFARLHAFYAAHLIKRAEFARAEEHLKVAESSLTDVRFGTTFVNPDDVIATFIALYHAWGKPTELERYEQLRQQSLATAIGMR